MPEDRRRDRVSRDRLHLLLGAQHADAELSFEKTVHRAFVGVETLLVSPNKTRRAA